MPNNGDKNRDFKVGNLTLRGLGSFHKTLPHNEYGEVNSDAYEKLLAATEGRADFADVPDPNAARLANPQAGLAHDRLTQHPVSYSMPPAPQVLSATTAAEMTELYWMALLRDVSFDKFATDSDVDAAATEIDSSFRVGIADTGDEGRLKTGVDVPGGADTMAQITKQNLFRLGLPGEELGPFVSQFFLRSVHFGTQQIDQKQVPYKSKRDYLKTFDEWLDAQRTGRDAVGQDYSHANENSKDNFEPNSRYISTPRDLARFVNKDALHQAYFNATLILLSGGAKWTPGNPYSDTGALKKREAGFGVLGAPHILALVSEIATRALKVVWNQKWQVNLRLRPEAYGGLVHVQEIGIGGSDGKRPYRLPGWVATTEAASKVRSANLTLLLPMAFTPGSPTHPAYGAGHATVAGVCVTILKAYFETMDPKNGKPIPFKFLKERDEPYGDGAEIRCYQPGVVEVGQDLPALPKEISDQLTIEGELNKLAMNVAMGRSIGGVHWRTDNSRSLALGEALAARVLADITVDCTERPSFHFRTFSRKSDGKPKDVIVRQGGIYVDGKLVDTNTSAL